MKSKAFLFAFALAVGLVILTAPDWPLPLRKGMFIFWIIGFLWITELFHLTITALLVPVLGILLQVNQARDLFAYFAHPILFIFLGGFALATAFRHQGLDHLMAARILLWAKGSLYLSCYFLFAITALLSMWMSNTAVVALMLPIALGLLSTTDAKIQPRIYLFLLLGIAYSASVGGMGTLVGSPPNALVAGALNLSFIDWLKVGLPVALVLLPGIWILLYLLIRPENANLNLQSLKPVELTGRHIKLLSVFLLTITGWLFSAQISNLLHGIEYIDSVIALCAVILLVASGSLSWREIDTGVDWGVLLLFGGGLCLGGVLADTGATEFLAEIFSAQLTQAPFIVFLIALITFVVFLTELTSNTASAALLIPLFLSIAHELEYSSLSIALAIGLSASCAFMLPVATPPNAIVYGSGHIPQKKMIQLGFVLNLFAIAALSSMLPMLLKP